MENMAMYTEDNFEEYYENLVKEYCAKEGIAFRLDEWDGARENMRDDAFDMEDNVAYTDQDLIDEYFYFCLNDDLSTFISTTPFANRSLAPDDQGEGHYAMHVYRDGDKPYSHYILSDMDVYRGTYTFDKATCSYSFTHPVKES